MICMSYKIRSALQFKKNSTVPVDFEDQVRDIDKALEWKVSENVQTVEGISDSLSPRSNAFESMSDGAEITPKYGPTLDGPLTEENMVSSAFVLGPDDEISQASNSTEGIVRKAPANLPQVKMLVRALRGRGKD